MTAHGGTRLPSIPAPAQILRLVAAALETVRRTSSEKTVSLDDLRQQARDACKRLRGLCEPDEVAKAKPLVEQARNVRDYETMGCLAEAVSRRDPKDAKNRRLYAQYLIDTGKATAAIDLLRPLAQRLPKSDPELSEATGLLGRAYKQIFFDAGDKTSAGARAALKQAILAYRKPYQEDRANTWHGVNLVALLTRARRLGLRFAPDLNPKDVAAAVVATLQATPTEKRDEWFLPTLAEASLGLGDWAAVEHNIRAYAAAADARAFHIASTLRHFTQVWDLEATDDRGRGLVNILRARLMQLPGGGLELEPAELQRLRSQTPPETGQLEAVLGQAGPQTYRWWKTGLDWALAVAVVPALPSRSARGFWCARPTSGASRPPSCSCSPTSMSSTSTAQAGHPARGSRDRVRGQGPRPALPGREDRVEFTAGPA